MRIFVVIPVHGRLQYTVRCLDSLRRQTAQGFDVIVVDDGSPDETADVLARDYPEVVLLHGDGNLWWSGAMNLGVSHALDAGAEYILALNNDTELAPDFVEQFKAAASKKPRALMVAVMKEHEAGRYLYAGERMRWATANRVFLQNVIPSERQHGLHPVTHCPGRGLWIPASVFRTLGLFDAERFPQTAADYDFTMRAARAGFDLFCHYDAVLYSLSDAFERGKRHRESYSLGDYFYYLTDIRAGTNLKGLWRFTLRNAPRHVLIPHLAAMTVRVMGGYLVRWAKHSMRSMPERTEKPTSSSKS